MGGSRRSLKEMLLGVLLPWKRRRAGSSARATLLHWNGRFHVYPHFVRGAVSMACTPVEQIAEAAGDGELGAAIHRAIARSPLIRRQPDDNEVAEVLRAIGAHSWRVLETQGRTLSLAVRGSEIEMTPLMPWADPDEGEHGLRGEERHGVPLDATAEVIGRNVRRLLSVSST